MGRNNMSEMHSEADSFPEQMPDESSWASQVVRFKAPTESVCLWANAAYNFLHKLQWQRPPGASEGDEDMDDFLSHANLKPYQCPVCHECYGSAPTHRDDCDLSLLLQQSGGSLYSWYKSGLAANLLLLSLCLNLNHRRIRQLTRREK